METVSAAKRCGKCSLWLPADTEHFYPDRSKRDGFGSYCRPCRRQASAAALAARPDEARARSAAYYRAHEERIRAASTAYYRAHRERAAAQNTVRRLANPERDRAYKRAWGLRNRHKTRDYLRQRRAAARGVGGAHTNVEWLALCEHYGNVCLCCGIGGLLERDHVLPITKGGSDNIDNIQPLCRSCNARKNNKHIDYRP